MYFARVSQFKFPPGFKKEKRLKIRDNRAIHFGRISSPLIARVWLPIRQDFDDSQSI